MAPDELGGERAGEAGRAGDDDPGGGIAVERLRVIHAATLRSRPAPRSIARAALGDLLVGQRAVRRRGTRAAARGSCAPRRPARRGRRRRSRRARSSSPPPSSTAARTRAGVDLLGDHDRDVLVDGRVGDHVLVGLAAVAATPRRARRRSISNAAAPLEVPLAADERMQLAEPAGLVRRRRAPSRRGPGAGTAAPSGSTVDLGAELARERLEHALQREEVGRAPARSRQLGGAQRPDRERRDAVRLERRRRALAGEAARRATPPAGAALGRGRRGRTRTAPRARRRGRGCSGRRRAASRAASCAARSARPRAGWRPGSAPRARRRRRGAGAPACPGSVRLRLTTRRSRGRASRPRRGGAAPARGSAGRPGRRPRAASPGRCSS